MATGVRHVYMHEIVRILGAGAHTYMEMTKEWASTRAGRGVRGVLFVQELSTVRPGAAADYLATMESEWVPVLRRLGLEVVGAFEGLMTDTEAVALWAAPNLDAYRGYLEHRLADPGVAAWRRRAREFVTSWRETLWHPAAGTPLSGV